MSPTIHREGPYRFYFNSREEMRMHIHVATPKGRAKFWLEPFVVLADFRGLRKHELNDIQRIVEEKEEVFKHAWREHFSG